MYFVMKDYSKSDYDRLGVYIEELPIELGYYDSFRLTCVETMETIIMRTLPTEIGNRTKTIVFHNLDGLNTIQVLAEYMVIGDSDYTPIGTYIFDVLESPSLFMFTEGEDNVAQILHKGGASIDNPRPKVEFTVGCEVIKG